MAVNKANSKYYQPVTITYVSPGTIQLSATAIPLVGYADNTGVSVTNSTFTVPAGMAGAWRVDGYLALTPPGGTPSPMTAGWEVSLQLTGSKSGALHTPQVSKMGTHAGTARFNDVVILQAGDVVTLNATALDGASGFTDGHFNITFLPATA